MIYNPYNTKQTNSGYPNHPGTMNQAIPQNYDPRQQQAYPQQAWSTPTPGYNPYAEAVPYSEEAYEELAVDRPVTAESNIKRKGTTGEAELACKNLPLAQIYVRPQTYQGINSPTEALKQWTAFPELSRPYSPKKGTKGGHRYE